MQDIEDIIKTYIRNDKAESCVIIVPNDAARQRRQRDLIAYHPNRAVANLQVYNIETFVQRLYNQVRPQRRHITSGIQNLWLHEIVNPNPDNGDAYVYNAFRPNPDVAVPDSTLSLITDTINNLKERCETVQNIAADTLSKTDLSHIYTKYEDKLKNNWIDDRGKHLYLAHHFEHGYFNTAYPKAKLVVVEGFTVLTKADIKLLKSIADIPEMEMWFRTDCFPENEHLYKNIIDLVNEFEEVGVNIDSEYERDPDNHNHFSKNLFQTNLSSDHRIDLSEQTKVLKPADRTEEIEQIAYLIQKHVSEDKCKLSEICVTFYNISNYQQRIAEIFPAFGIPYSLAESIPLTKSEVVKEILSRLSPKRKSLGNTYFKDVDIPSSHHYLHPDDFHEYVEQLLNTGKVLHRILNTMPRKNTEIVEGEINALQQFRRIVKELCDVMKSEGDEVYSLNDYAKKLNYIAKHTHYQNRAQTKAETVKIAKLGELRSYEYKIVFLGDFVDGGFPPHYRPDPLLPDNPYRTEEELLHDNRFLFYRVLKSFRKRLYLLVPKRENVTELIPSLFLTQLEVIANIGTEEIANPTERSIPGFLSTYGEYVAKVDEPSDVEFPADAEDMKQLIEHVVKVEKSREETPDNLDYGGILTEENLSSQSRSFLQNLSKQPFSVTDLETYAKCPFQYFVAKIMKSTIPEEEEDVEPSSLEKGDLAHKILCNFYMERRKSGDLPISKYNDDDFEQAKQQLDAILNSKSEEKRIDRKDISENNLFWKIEIDKLQTALHKWIEAERLYSLSVVPSFFEVSIGPTNQLEDQKLKCSEPLTIGGVKIRGRIDRIDIGNGSFNIIDYKTGSSTVRLQDILEGRSLQLPIYLQIAEQLLDENGFPGLEAAAGLYHKIRLDECKVELGIATEIFNDVAYRTFNGNEWKKAYKSKQLLEETAFSTLLERINGYVKQYVDSITNGRFPLITRVDTYVESEDEGDTPIAPKEINAPCNYCAYKRVCRVGAFVEATQTDEGN